MSSPAVAHPQAESRPRATRPAILVPFDAREALPLKAAAATANRSQSTIRGWCSLHAIGRRIPFNFFEGASTVYDAKGSPVRTSVAAAEAQK